MSEIIFIKTKLADKELIYDCINNKLFLVEVDKDDKLSFSTYRKAKSIVALGALLCIPVFWITQYINIPIILFYLLAFYFKRYVKQFFIDPTKEKVKSKYWEPISHEQASQIVEYFNAIEFACLTFASMTLSSVVYCCYDEWKMKFMGMFGILFLGSMFFALIEDYIISYKLIKKLKKMRTT